MQSVMQLTLRVGTDTKIRVHINCVKWLIFALSPTRNFPLIDFWSGIMLSILLVLMLDFIRIKADANLDRSFQIFCIPEVCRMWVNYLHLRSCPFFWTESQIWWKLVLNYVEHAVQYSIWTLTLVRFEGDFIFGNGMNLLEPFNVF